MTTFQIHPYTTKYHTWAADFLKREWGSLQQVSRGTLYNVVAFPGFVALVNGEPAGIITYRIEANACEVLMIHSSVEGLGVGSAMLEAVQEVARRSGCKRLWLITTNDNIRAFRWYQKRGFIIAAVHVNALEISRQLKPEIPLLGDENIPLRDEIEFEIIL